MELVGEEQEVSLSLSLMLECLILGFGRRFFLQLYVFYDLYDLFTISFDW